MEPEVIEISDINDTSVINLGGSGSTETIGEQSSSSKQPSVNFGAGVELLMNNKKMNKGKESSTIDIADLNDLEKELNDLSDAPKMKIDDTGKSENIEIKTQDIGLGLGSLSLNSGGLNSSILGKATAEQVKKNESDNMLKFNNIPINPDKFVPEKPRMSQDDILREKHEILSELDELKGKPGVKLAKNYTIESSLMEMKSALLSIKAKREKQNSIKFQGKVLMALISGIEFLNNKANPFDVNLDGWGEQINENIGDYDEIFAELHEKYKSKVKMAPELKLLFQLAGSGIMVHMTNTMFKSAIPGMDDIMRQNPELMQQFTQAAINTMGQNNPGFGGFMNTVMEDNRRPNMPPNMSSGPPPPPMRTKVERSQRSQIPVNRPDIQMSREQQGVDIGNNFGQFNSQPQQRTSRRRSPPPSQPTTRPEMKGPSDINDILSGLKTKKVNIQQSRPNGKPNESTISVQELKEIASAKIPTRTKGKRNRKSRTSVSLDI